MELEDVLSQKEIKEYHREWDSFTDKYVPESKHKVHSGLPIIGKVFQFRDKPVFRAHIFKRKLKKAFDPYFISDGGYLYNYFHTVHYFFPIEQICHTSLSKLIANYQDYIITDILDSKIPQKLGKRIDFTHTRASIGFVLDITQGKDRFSGRATAIFYNDKANERLQVWYLRGIATLRNYIRTIKTLKEGNNKAKEDLIRKIEKIAIQQKKLIKKRDLLSKNELMEKLKSGEIPEEELHDFFSYWDKE